MKLARGDLYAIALALAGAVVLVVSAFADARAALFAWLVAFGATLAIVLGALTMLMIGIVAHASWPLVFRKPLEALVWTLPLQALFFLPIAIFVKVTYAWAMSPTPLDAEQYDKLEAKRAWLNVPFWELRAAICFLVFFAIAFTLLRASARQDAGDVRATATMRAVAGGGMPPLAIALTVGAFDWLMSIEPSWYSNAYGLYLFVAAFSSAVAVAAIVFARLRASGALPEKVSASHAHAIGNVLLAAVILWAYIAFAQLLIYWIADIPEEIEWYARRVSHGWGWIAFALGALHFGLPFVALLMRGLKRDARTLAAIGVVVLLGHAIDVWWLVSPVVHARLVVPWRELAALATTGSLTFVVARVVARGRAREPVHDPLYPAALRFEMR